MEAVAVIGEDIQLLRLLGRGGMGTVWLARRAGELVAVKMMLPKLACQPRAVARFGRELRILQSLRARHSVRLLGTGVHDGQPYAVMENVAGASLADRFDTHGKPPRAIAFRIVHRLLMALAEVHAECVVHRDVKPANIMLCGDDDALDVRLVDFGVASSDGEPRAALGDDDATVVGTGPYMSPEQLIEAGEGSVHEDMWAAAVVAYECVMGRLPFDGPSFAGICRIVDKGSFVAPSLACPDLPPAIDAWFTRAFAKPLDRRFPSAAEMAAAWDQATGDGLAACEARTWSGDEKRAITAALLLTRASGRQQKVSGTRLRERSSSAWAVAVLVAATAVVFVAAAFAPP
jgi:eukaryotic-like serine/threonine-protein kinase